MIGMGLGAVILGVQGGTSEEVTSDPRVGEWGRTSPVEI